MTPDLAPEQLLKVGLAALKRRDYDRAIATFKQLQATDVPKAYQLKAQMGLVRVYEAQFQWPEARQLCHLLLKSPSAQIRTWAKDTISDLDQAEKKTVSENTPVNHPVNQNLSGFQPLPPENNRSGFQPLAPENPRGRPNLYLPKMNHP